MATLHAVAHQVLDHVVGADHPVPDAVPNGDQDADQVGLSISEAARQLGVSREAMRQRIRRGTVRSAKVDGAWVVYLDGPGTTTPDSERTDHSGGRPDAQRTDTDPDDVQGTSRIELIDQLRDENSWLRTRLEAAEQERAELRRLLAQAQGGREARLLDTPHDRFRHESEPPPHVPEPPTTRHKRPWWSWWRRA